MTTTAHTPLKTLDAQELNQLARHKGPCIKIPDVHPGTAAGSRPAYLRQLTQDAAQALRDLHRSLYGNGLARSLEQLGALLETDHGGPGITLLVAPGTEMVYQTPGLPPSD